MFNFVNTNICCFSICSYNLGHFTPVISSYIQKFVIGLSSVRDHAEMFSSYLSVSSVDHGLIGFNAQSYGGFAYRKDTLEREDGVSGDPTRRFLTEHK